jgi:hypothetical protein
LDIGEVGGAVADWISNYYLRRNILYFTEGCRRELKLLAGPPKPVRSRMREEAKNNPRRRELRYKFP